MAKTKDKRPTCGEYPECGCWLTCTGKTPMSDPQPPARATAEQSAVERLGALLQEANAVVKFGLRSQGKFETVRRMLRDGRTPTEIGAAIGWNGATAVRYFAIEAADELTKQSTALSRVRALVEEALEQMKADANEEGQRYIRLKQEFIRRR